MPIDEDKDWEEMHWCSQCEDVTWHWFGDNYVKPICSICEERIAVRMMCQCEYISHIITGGCKNEAAVVADTAYGVYNVCKECANRGHMLISTMAKLKKGGSHG